MRLAWFSPLPPLHSGISDYSVLVLRALAAHAEVDLWVSGFDPAPELAHRHRVRRYHPRGASPAQLAEYDAVVYHIGNHAGYHGPIYETLRGFPGIVVLHDFVLHSLMMTHFQEVLRDPRALRALVPLHYGLEGKRFVEDLIANTAERNCEWERTLRYPLNESVLNAATGVIVHSRFVEQRLAALLPPARVRRLPHPAFPIPTQSAYSRRELELPEDGKIVASLGFVTRNKRCESIARSLPRGVHYLLVGEIPRGYSPALGRHAQCTGFLPIEKVYAYLRHVDVVLNLRNPTMGETSASLLRAFSLERAAVVCDLGWYGELPDDCVVKLAPERTESALSGVIESLLDDDARRARLGAAARDYLDRHCRPTTFAAGLLDFARGLGRVEMRPERFATQFTRQLGTIMSECGSPPEALVKKVAAELSWI